MNAPPRILLLFLAAVTWSLGFWTATTRSSTGTRRSPGDFSGQAATVGPDAAQKGAVCPVVYQLDQSPSARGYHYQFFGNAFFINEQGFLLTDAHVLDSFRDGGQPYILVNRREGPPQLLRANIVAIVKAHDVAVLRAEPNPFAGGFRTVFLMLSAQPAIPGEAVMALSLHPAHPRHTQSFQSQREDRSPSQVLSFQSTRLENSAEPAAIFLLSHPVDLGQSGSPVLAVVEDSSSGAQLGPVVGMVEGRWLRGSLPTEHDNSSTVRDDVPGAALPIAYAIDLLQQKSIVWHSSAISHP